MPFYFRKSVSAGPFRFNFSKGGVGLSVGVRGLRFGTGPRGHYVHAGRNGFYYRASLGRAGQPTTTTDADRPRSRVPLLVPDEPGVKMVDIESGDVGSMRDEAFGDLLDEINTKQRLPRLATILGLGTAALGVGACFALGTPGLVVFFLVLPAWALGLWLDSYRRATVLFYDLDDEIEQIYTDVTASFDAISACAGKWHIEAGGTVEDITTWKRNAGASHLVRKKSTALAYKLPRVVKSNVTPPSLGVGRQVIYFMPDVALVEDGNRIGAVGYGDLNIAWHASNFIEEGKVPRDSHIIGYTWKHPNRSGGPDRRFKDNYQIPICEYEAMHLTSDSGVNEIVELSHTGLVEPFARALKSLQPREKATHSTRDVLLQQLSQRLSNLPPLPVNQTQ